MVEGRALISDPVTELSHPDHSYISSVVIILSARTNVHVGCYAFTVIFVRSHPILMEIKYSASTRLISLIPKNHRESSSRPLGDWECWKPARPSRTHFASFANRIPTLPISKRPTGRFPVVFGINDMSLVRGGIFDLHQNWMAPHEDHSEGVAADVDVRTGTQDDDYAAYVRMIWMTKLGHRIGDERAAFNHFHLRN